MTDDRIPCSPYEIARKAYLTGRQMVYDAAPLVTASPPPSCQQEARKRHADADDLLLWAVSKVEQRKEES